MGESAVGDNGFGDIGDIADIAEGEIGDIGDMACKGHGVLDFVKPLSEALHNPDAACGVAWFVAFPQMDLATNLQQNFSIPEDTHLPGPSAALGVVASAAALDRQETGQACMPKEERNRS